MSVRIKSDDARQILRQIISGRDGNASQRACQHTLSISCMDRKVTFTTRNGAIYGHSKVGSVTLRAERVETEGLAPDALTVTFDERFDMCVALKALTRSKEALELTITAGDECVLTHAPSEVKVSTPVWPTDPPYASETTLVVPMRVEVVQRLARLRGGFPTADCTLAFHDGQHTVGVHYGGAAVSKSMVLYNATEVALPFGFEIDFEERAPDFFARVASQTPHLCVSKGSPPGGQACCWFEPDVLRAPVAVTLGASS